jgi:hypothetical protein
MADGDPIILGGANGSDGTTFVSRSGTASNTAFSVYNDNGSAVQGDVALAHTGVVGTSETGVGVHGRADSGVGVEGRSVYERGVDGRCDEGIGVFGEAGMGAVPDVGVPGIGVGGATRDGYGVIGSASGFGTGVEGRGVDSIGVMGRSQRSTGVFGSTKGGPGSTGVRGHADKTVGVWGTGGDVGVVGQGTNIGVLAQMGGSTAIGVKGESDRDAVVGTSFRGGRGVVGETFSTTTASGIGVHGIATTTSGSRTAVAVRADTTNAIGLMATAAATGIAGGFLGDVMVVGNFTSIGGLKSAAVPHPDGTHRLTYCMESPESWFEDFGRARLTRGRAEVRLDRDFAALVRTDDFHVFLTAEGETVGLYVADRSETGFEVREQRGGDGEVPFSYRVVARRRDVDAGRLAEFELPEFPPEPERVAPPPELPELPELPEPRDLPSEWPPWPNDEPKAAD